MSAGGVSVDVIVASHNGNKYLKTKNDGLQPDNLLSLPECKYQREQHQQIHLAFRNIGGGGLFFHKDRLYLQFHKGRLAGWKGDWGHNWMWQ